MTLPTSFSVDYMGSSKLDVPIDVPPGTAGMVPHLSLSYSSSNGNGYVGVGWTLSGLPAITRCPGTIATDGAANPVTLTSADVFCFQGQPLVQAQQQSAAGQQTSQGQQFEPGQQLLLTGGTYGAAGATYTTEIEGFSRIVSNGTAGNGPASFTVYTRSGLIYDFGGVSGSDSQVVCTTPSPCTTVMTWMLDQVTDTVGNTINITYEQNGSRAYPTTILYTSNTGQGLAATNRVSFLYETGRADAPTQYLAGQPVQTALLLQTITTAVETSGTWNNASVYSLAYGSGLTLTGRSQLQTITRTGASGGTLLPASFTYCDSCGAPADLMATFDNGLAGATTLTYALTVHSSVYGYLNGTPSPTYPSQNLSTPRYVVSQVSAPNGIGGQYLVNYSYFNALQNLQGRGFLGFASVWAADPQTQLLKATGYSQAFPTIGDTTSVLVDNTSQSKWIQVKNVVTSWCSLTNDCAAEGATAYNTLAGSSTPRTYPYVSQIVTTQNDLLTGAPMPTTTQTFTPDTYGNDTTVKTTTVQDYGGTNTTYTTTASYGFQNDLAGWSATNGDNWIIGRLTSSSVSASFTDANTPANSSTNAARVIDYTVDETTGFTSTQTIEPGVGTGFTVATTFGYDAYGNKKSTSSVGDGQTRVDGWSYTQNGTDDPGHEFPDSVTNALSQTAYNTYALQWGLPTTVTDIDGRVTKYTYDDLGRKTSELLPDQSTTTTKYQFCNGVNNGTLAGCPTGAQYAITTVDMGADGKNEMSPAKVVYYDTLDREIESTEESFNGSLAYVAKAYNTQLQLASVTRPYFSTGTPELTSYQYDALNRVTQTNYPDSSSDKVAYVQTNKTITVGITSSSAGESISKSYDGRGNLTQSSQPNPTGTPTNIVTTFLYDGFNNLTKVTDANTNVTAYTYDALGRKTGITDPDAGSRTQTYTAFGELQSVLDGLNTTAWMTYDALSRMTLRCWTNGQPQGDVQTCPNPTQNEIKETWSYDPTNGIGELGGETSTHGYGYAATHTYNSASPTLGLLGQPATSTITISQKPFSYSYSYDGDNRPSSYTSPSGAVPTTIRNSYSYISQLTDATTLDKSKTSPVIWTANSRDAENHLTSATFGNGTNGLYTYDPETGRQKSYLTNTTNTSNTALQSATLTWDQLGNLIERNDAGNHLDEKYGYDTLNRLQSITLNGAAENSFTYDVLGNMLKKGDVGTYAYPPAGQPQPHGVASIAPTSGGTATTFTYDADGNVTAETGATARSIVPTIFNMMRHVVYDNTIQLQFSYDADHGRVLQAESNGGTTTNTYYLPDGELTPPNGTGGPVWHTYFEVDGQRVAEATGANAAPSTYGPATALTHNYFHLDDQNTISLVTNDSFNASTETPIPQNELSDVFGQPRLTTGAIDTNWGANDVTKRRYINQEDLTDAHLIDLNARIYDPLIGKFFSPDPVIADQDDSQSWNAYAYSHNNPMSKEDPTGLWYVPGRNPSASAAGAYTSDAITDLAITTLFGDMATVNMPPTANTLQGSIQSTSSNSAHSTAGGSSQVAGNDKSPVQSDASAQVGGNTQAQQQNPNQAVGNTTEGSLAKVLTNEDGSLSTPKGGDPQQLVDGKTALANAIYNNANLDHPEKVAPATGTPSAQDSQIMQGVVTSRTNGGADPVQGRVYYGTSHTPNLNSRSAGNGLKGAAGRETVFAKFGPFKDSISSRPTYIYIYNNPGH